MSHRAVIQALSGLLLGMLVAILSSTVVSTSLPRIIGDLGGSQASYTWVVTATLLATTVSTPIWGKFADLFNRKLLVQLSLAIFVIGSALAGLSQNSGELIGFRVLQGLGAGGLTALATVIIADIISPRERGRYMGLLGAVMAVGTVGGPLLGGVITDSIGWRWNFYVGVPLAAVAIVLLQKTLHLPTRRRDGVRIDVLGVALITGAVSLLLIWVTLGGHQFAWGSATSIVMVIGAVLLAVLFVVVELRVAEPILPLDLFRNRTFVLAVVASLAVGVAMFGTSVFLSQYMQLARGKTPTMSGILTIPMIAGVLLASTIAGQLISRTGFWKRYVVTGSAVLVVGLLLMGTIRYDTGWVPLSVYMFLVGVGVGMVMQNLVLVVQNTLPQDRMGSGTAAVAFFRSLGGAIGVSVMGAVLSSRVGTLTAAGMAELGLPTSGGSGTIPDLATLPAPVRTVVESAYGEAVGDIFLLAVPLAIITLVAVVFLPNAVLGTRSGVQQQTGSDEAGAAPVLADQLVDEAEAATALVPATHAAQDRRRDALD
ncbi:DHA2 family efflux MFS transporter permease subunit [Nakamurella sp. YIM 132087]|uniref:DHA2 family efflux MFS transporter permease subunit n=2 Tax=Nakamurella alba TaxID=2665158 RepID=A0A7K1FP78_9ACTN|nr:DHA2 family efflux MFS transporter permease subunit [Nakamurella alba]